MHQNGGNVFISNSYPFSPNNGAVLTILKIIKSAMSYAAEAELSALFINLRKAVYMSQILKEMGHKQDQR